MIDPDSANQEDREGRRDNEGHKVNGHNEGKNSRNA